MGEPQGGIAPMTRKRIPLAIAYDFDGTLAPGNMQEYDFVPAIDKVASDVALKQSGKKV